MSTADLFFGWVEMPAAVEELKDLLASAGKPVTFSQLPGADFASDENVPVFFWLAERLILGRVLPSWDQKNVGTCVSMGFGRGAQDLLLLEVMNGEQEEWPGAEVATEPIYALSRVEVGRNRISGDGSTGAWAARAVRDWGILLRKVYGQHDLTTYSTKLSREWGRTGCPDDLEPQARLHPVTEVVQVRSGDELWKALGAYKPVPLCSNRGFELTLRDGFCEPSGSWAHCMLARGRFVHPRRGRSIIIQNSWGNYLSGRASVEVDWPESSRPLRMMLRELQLLDNAERLLLPQGCFATTLEVAGNDMVSARSGGDSWALAGLKGWQRTRTSWIP